MGMARQCWARHRSVGRDMARNGRESGTHLGSSPRLPRKARQSLARRGTAGRGRPRRGTDGQGKAWKVGGTAYTRVQVPGRHARLGPPWRGFTGLGDARLAGAGQGMGNTRAQNTVSRQDLNNLPWWVQIPPAPRAAGQDPPWLGAAVQGSASQVMVRHRVARQGRSGDRQAPRFKPSAPTHQGPDGRGEAGRA
jgi:hypothetical protein